MTEPITLQGILTILGLIVAIVAGCTAIGAIIKWITGVHDKMQQWDGYEQKMHELEARMSDHQTDIEARLQEIRTEQEILTSSMLAVLDGLQQLKCNGNVTKAHTALEQYLNDRAHH